jgi:hypothetical protein
MRRSLVYAQFPFEMQAFSPTILLPMPDSHTIDHSQQMTPVQRAAADKERLAKMAPAFAKAYADGAPTRDRHTARMNELLAKPEAQRSAREKQELENLIHHDIMVMAGVVGDVPAAAKAAAAPRATKAAPKATK